VAQGKNQKSRPRGGLCAYIPVFGHEVNEKVGQSAGRDDCDEELPGLASASWGQPKKQIQATRPTLVMESANKVV
jgi:hypothetical protein